jgi:glycosyltransferase involved in cell wall biosynthesis
MASGPALSVVVPVYRNAETLGELVGRLRAATGVLGEVEVILVIDASPDASLEVAERLVAADPLVGVVALSENLGQQRAVREGLRQARGAAVATMDGDLQDRPEDLPRLVTRMGEGFGAVFARRPGAYQRRGRMLTSRLFKAVLSRLARLPDRYGMFLVMTAALAREVVACPAREPYIPALVGLSGARIGCVDVERAHRPVGESSFSPWRRVRFAWNALRFALRWRILPGRRHAAAPLPPPGVRLLGACRRPVAP